VPGLTTTHRAARTGFALSLVGLLGLTTALTASAEPEPVYPSQSQVDSARRAVTTTAGKVASLDAAYAAASARLSQVQQRAAAAAEAYNGARLKLARRSAEARAAQQRAAQAEQVAEAASLEVRQYAAAVYQQGGSLGDLEAYLSSNGPQDLMDRVTALETVGEARNRSLQRASATSVVADTMRRQAAHAQAQQVAAAQQAEQAHDAAKTRAQQAQAASARIQQEQRGLATQLAALRKTSVDLEQQRQAGLRAAAEARAAAAAAAEQARRAAARAQASRDAAARAAARRAQEEAARQAAAAQAAQEEAQQQQSRPTPKPKPKPSAPPPPPSSGGVSAVLAYARAQIGKPYQWGAEGPDSFDCSGLTMMAWRQAGVYLSHYTGAQYAETARVPISDLQPGDLVFFGSSGESSHHMGLYVGDGQMIEAPYTGANVRYGSIYRSDLVPYGGRP
jgi:cell wall-associated NlpC family hydrolase